MQPPKAQTAGDTQNPPSNAQAKGLTSAAPPAMAASVPHWREAKPDFAHRRGKRFGATSASCQSLR
jgi:hypothetical protein